jgi:hypothetical protein
MTRQPGYVPQNTSPSSPGATSQTNVSSLETCPGLELLLARLPAVEMAVVVGADVDRAVARRGRVPRAVRVFQRQPMQQLATLDVEDEQFGGLAADDGADEPPAGRIAGERGSLERHRRDLHAEVFKFSDRLGGFGGRHRNQRDNDKHAHQL